MKMSRTGLSERIFRKMYCCSGRMLMSAVLFVSVTAWGQVATEKGRPAQTVRGVVIDGSSGAPISYATVRLSGGGMGTVTDSLGCFGISQVPVGRYTVEAAFMGYEPGVFREVLVTSAKEVYLEIPLKESVNELNEVVIRAGTNKEEAMNKMATVGARMLSVEEASRYAGGFDDPARLVSSFAGVAPGVSSNGISIHGNAPHLLQWRLEDVEIPNPNHFADIATLGGGILSSLSSQVLGNSDFFTGAFPAEYGNAISGVFDMKLRNGNNRKNENTFQVGIMGIDIASEGPLSKKHRASYLFNYRYSTTGLLNLKGGKMDYQDLNFKLNFPTRKAGTFSVWGTSLIDKFANDFEKNVEKWKYWSDRSESKDKQYMAAGGVSHRYFFTNEASLKTTVAVTYSQLDGEAALFDGSMKSTPYMDIGSRYANLILSTVFNRKFSSRFTNKTGLTYVNMFYRMNFAVAPYEAGLLETISLGKGNTSLVSAYNSSSVGLAEHWTLNAGIYGQFLTLNNKWSVEPRIGLKWQVSPKTTLALAYGIYSRMEKTDVYFVKAKEADGGLVNKDLGFTKAQHIMLSFGYKLSDRMNLKIEPYVQLLHDVPVIADSSYSVLNRSGFYVEDALVNKGRGRNVGVDITFERFLEKGFYFLVSGSWFDSRYRGGDGVWRNTKFNRNYVMNGLAGKEWMLGRNRQNIFSVNLKLTLQGGDRYSPVDVAATMSHPDKEVQYDETKAFSKQYSPMLIGNYTVSYRINKRNVSHEFAVKGLNFMGAKEHYGHEYNVRTGKIDASSNATILTNVSYKLEF